MVRLLAALLLLSAAPAAQQYVLSNEDRARLVAIDFTAFDADGRPVTDLRPEDVTLRIDGRTRAIRALEWIPAGATTRRVPPPFASNTLTEDSRAVLFVIDDETLKPGREQELKTEIKTFVSRLGAADRVALVTVPYGGMKSDFTLDRDRFLAALDPLTGRAPQTESASDAGCRSRSTLVALAGTLDSIASADAPLTVVFVTGHLTPPRGVTSLSRSASGVPGVDYFNTMGTCEVLPDHYQAIADAAAKARAQFFVVQPDLLADPSGRVGLEHLTGLTGGPLWNLTTTDTDRALDRVLSQTAGYYLARVQPEPQESADLVRGYSVSVNRPGVTVRHRPRLQLRAGAAPAAEAGQPDVLLALMRRPRIATDLPLRVTTATSRHTDGQLKLMVLFDAPLSTQIGAPMIGLFDAGGRMVVANTARPEDVKGGNTGLLAVAAPPGRYRLRLSATEGTSPVRLGSVDTDVEVGLVEAGPLRLSGLLLGQARAEGFTPKLEFRAEASGVALLEIYGGKPGTPVGVAFELAAAAGGPPILTMPGVIAPTSEPDRFIVTATLPVGALPPGDYEVRALVAAQGEAVGRVTRTLRKLPPQ